ncbi:hypothetical protein J5U22_03131 [Saccharolobus shibatae]|uniref:Uncharacterized protein n=1 Tax=Saccharolobus shibatae TaxID=2286 RepID=A0A8F5H102_9CREN|nr:hypothetical protein J5U22_03131 [Saccharolobus shibatae]
MNDLEILINYSLTFREKLECFCIRVFPITDISREGLKLGKILKVEEDLLNDIEGNFIGCEYSNNKYIST